MYSYTQISQYLSCPRRYRHRYIDGWNQKDNRAAMLFGRAFELALGAYFRKEDPGEVLFHEWTLCKTQGLQFSNCDTWDRMLEQGIMLLTRFCQDDRVHVPEPRKDLQIKISRRIAGNEFIAYIDAIGELDGKLRLLEWKSSSGRYPESPSELLTLDPQLVCYSWLTGMADVAQVVFVRKRVVEVQYLETTIADAQRAEFGQLVEDTIRRIDAGHFLPHSGVRFPHNPCITCPYLGLCLGRQDLATRVLTRRPGAEDFDWINELAY
jgi:PD-(D/E)XK nuclease superfamily